MLKGALLLVGGFVPRLRQRTAPAEVYEQRHSLRAEWVRLVESDFDEALTHQFAEHTPAQELPAEVFAALLSSGSRDLASYFFERDPRKGDLLDSNKIRLLLETPCLRFIDRNGRMGYLEHQTQRAIRLLAGFADIEPAGLAKLMLDKNCALTALALWPKETFGDEVVKQMVARAGGFLPCDVKRFCASPDTYTVNDGTTISEVDLVIIKTILRNPGRVMDILFRQVS